MITRPVEKKDMKEVIELLQQISSYIPEEKEYDSIWKNLCSQKNLHTVVVEENNEIRGYGAVLIEHKMKGGNLGHIEDIVVSNSCHEQGVGRVIMEYLKNKAKEQGCYKMALQCGAYNQRFYEKCGYSLSGVGMCLIL